MQIRWLLEKCADDWEWVYNTIVLVVQDIEDREWREEEFREALKLCRARVPKKDEEDYDLHEVIDECLGR